MQYRLLQPTHPRGGRTYGSLLVEELAGSHRLVLFAGARCVGQCKCFGDVWTFDPVAAQPEPWRELPAENNIFTRLKQRAVLHNGTIITTGGESFEPYMYHNSVQVLYMSRTPPPLPWRLPTVTLSPIEMAVLGGTALGLVGAFMLVRCCGGAAAHDKRE